jgi:hypothetical protein
VLEYSGVAMVPVLDPQRVECKFRCLKLAGCSQGGLFAVDVVSLCQNSTGLQQTRIASGSVRASESPSNLQSVTSQSCVTNNLAVSGYPETPPQVANFTHGGFIFVSALSPQNSQYNPALATWTSQVKCGLSYRCDANYTMRTLCLPTAGTKDFFPIPEVSYLQHLGLGAQGTGWNPSLKNRFSMGCQPGKFLVGGGCAGDPSKKIFPISSFPGSNFEWTCDFACYLGESSCNGEDFFIKVNAVCADCPNCVRPAPATTGATTNNPSVSSAATTGGGGTSAVVTTATATTGRPVSGFQHEFSSDGFLQLANNLSLFCLALFAIVSGA